MDPRTHDAIDPALCGTPRSISPGRATVDMVTTEIMGVDDQGLVHGGFIFGLADHAAMLAINEPTVVLTAASVRFLKPVGVGDTLRAVAEAGADGAVEVAVTCDDRVVMNGTFSCLVLDRHVMER